MELCKYNQFSLVIFKWGEFHIHALITENWRYCFEELSLNSLSKTRRYCPRGFRFRTIRLLIRHPMEVNSLALNRYPSEEGVNDFVF